MSCAKQSNVRARRDRSYLRNRFHPTYCGIRSRCWPSRRLETSGKYPFGLATAAFKQPTFTRALIPRRNSKRSICWRHQRSAQGVSVHRISSLPCSRRNLYGAQNPAIRLILTAPSRPRPRNHTLPICTVMESSPLPYLRVSRHTAQAFQKDALRERPGCCTSMIGYRCHYVPVVVAPTRMLEKGRQRRANMFTDYNSGLLTPEREITQSTR